MKYFKIVYPLRVDAYFLFYFIYFFFFFVSQLFFLSLRLSFTSCFLITADSFVSARGVLIETETQRVKRSSLENQQGSGWAEEEKGPMEAQRGHSHVHYE